MTLLSLKIRGHRTSEKWLCHEESQKLVHGSEPIWTPHASDGVLRQRERHISFYLNLTSFLS